MNIRNELISKNIYDLIDGFVNVDNVENYSDIYFGIVVNNTDPKNIGRCKIRVYTLFSPQISDLDLPWAIPDFHFIGSKKGSFVVPPVDAVVRVYFDHGDIYCPVYTSKGLREDSIPKATPDNMIMYYTDKDDYFSINRLTSETVLKHSTGTIVTIDAVGKVTIKANQVEIANDAGGSVTDSLTGGPFNSIIMCPYTGKPHQGKLVTNTYLPPLT